MGTLRTCLSTANMTVVEENILDNVVTGAEAMEIVIGCYAVLAVFKGTVSHTLSDEMNHKITKNNDVHYQSVVPGH